VETKAAPPKIRQLKEPVDVSSLSIYVIVQSEWKDEVFKEPRLDPTVNLCFGDDEAEAYAWEIAEDRLIDGGHENDDLKIVWRDDKVPTDLTDLDARTWHIDLLKTDGTVVVRDYSTVHEADITDLVADMPDEIMEIIREIQAEANDIDLVITPTKGPRQ
jgi:hypothetical protein